MIDHRRVVIENLVCEGLCAPGGRHAFHGQQVFRGVRNPVQWATVVTALNFFFSGFGLFDGNFRSQAGVSVETQPELLATVEISLRQSDGREFLRFDTFREFAYRKIENLFARHSGGSSGILRRSCWFWNSKNRRGLPLPLHQWLEVKPWPVSVIRGERAQAIQRPLGFCGQTPNIAFLSVREPAAI